MSNAGDDRPCLIIESPYAGDTFENEQFARNICRYSVKQGYAPYASHLFYTQFLDDDDPEERQHGIDCGFKWGTFANEVWFCLRPGEGFSPGMRAALQRHKSIPRRGMVFTQSGEYLHDFSLELHLVSK